MTAYRMRSRFRALLPTVGALICLTGSSPASGATPAQALRPVKLSVNGDRFYNYDGAKNYRIASRDWPISTIFYGDADVRRVKNFLDGRGYRRTGGPMWLAYRNQLTGQFFRFDGDSGKKDPCDAQHNNNHMRVYGGGLDRLYDPRYGYFVVASTHRDHGDGTAGTCNATDDYFGYSETVEHHFAQVASTSFTVNEDYKSLRNQEPFRTEGDHRWESDGKATVVLMP